MSQPTSEQRSQEAAFLNGSIADVAVLALQLVFAITTLSLTLISESLRALLLMAVDFYTYFVLRALHRDRFRHFHFGIGKLEQMCSLAIGISIVFGGLWVSRRVIETLFFGEASATPFGLAMAAIVSALNTMINFYGWHAMLAARGDNDSAIYTAQLRSRQVGLVCSLVVQVTLTAAVLSQDPVVAVWLDGLGATFVAGLMVVIGCKMVAQCLPDILDHSAPPEIRRRVDELLRTAGIDSNSAVQVRTRRSGSLSHVELALASEGHRSVAEFRARAHDIERLLERELPNAEVTVLLNVARP